MELERKFAIFYADGSVYEGVGKKDWLAAPSDGVQAVVMEDPYVSRVVVGDSDFYAWIDGKAGGTVNNTDDLGAWLRASGLVKFGLCIDDEEYMEIRRKVKSYKGISRNGPRKQRPEDFDDL